MRLGWDRKADSRLELVVRFFIKTDGHSDVEERWKRLDSGVMVICSEGSRLGGAQAAGLEHCAVELLGGSQGRWSAAAEGMRCVRSLGAVLGWCGAAEVLGQWFAGAE